VSKCTRNTQSTNWVVLHEFTTTVGNQIIKEKSSTQAYFRKSHFLLRGFVTKMTFLVENTTSILIYNIDRSKRNGLKRDLQIEIRSSAVPPPRLGQDKCVV
jgi:hypothetical protein